MTKTTKEKLASAARSVDNYHLIASLQILADILSGKKSEYTEQQAIAAATEALADPVAILREHAENSWRIHGYGELPDDWEPDAAYVLELANVKKLLETYKKENGMEVSTAEKPPSGRKGTVIGRIDPKTLAERTTPRPRGGHGKNDSGFPFL